MMNTSAAATFVRRQKGAHAAVLLTCGIVSLALVEDRYRFRCEYDDASADTRLHLQLLPSAPAPPSSSVFLISISHALYCSKQQQTHYGMEGTAVTKLEFSDSYFSSAYVDWSPIFLALGMNAGLKTLLIDVNGWA
jgi:hypothetical protein